MNTSSPLQNSSIDSPRTVRDLANTEFIAETGTGKLIRGSIYVSLTVFGLFLAWAYFASFQEIVKTDGTVVPREDVRTIQHLEGGILSEVFVRRGQVVDVGEILARLDGSQAKSQLAQNDSRLTALKLEEERLRAISEGRSPNFDSVVGGHEELKLGQKQIYEAEINAIASEKSVIDKQILEGESELSAIKNEFQNLSSQMTVLNEEFSIQQDLYKKKLKPRLNFLNAKQNLLVARRELQRVKDREKTLFAGIDELKERRLNSDKQLRQDTLRKLGKILSQEAETEKSTASLKDRVDRLVVRSPVAGLIQDLPLKAQAGVIPPGGVVAEIVPIHSGLLVDAKVNTRDVGFLNIGQVVTVKVSAFDFARYGAISGKLTSISPTTFLSGDNTPYYLAKIALDKIYVGEDSKSNLIIPGMTVQADITTGQKTVLEYLLKPLYTVVNEAFWER